MSRTKRSTNVQPRRRGGRERRMEARALCEPGLDARMHVCGVVVHDQMQLPVIGRDRASSESILAGSSSVGYTASKTAVSGLTRALAAELAPEGVRVNAIAPGIVDTPVVALTNDARAGQRARSRIPTKRFAASGRSQASRCSSHPRRRRTRRVRSSSPTPPICSADGVFNVHR